MRLLLRHMQPCLYDDDPFLEEHFLRPIDLFQGGIECVAVRLAQDPLLKDAMMPGAQHEADAALRRHIPPVAPFERTQAFLLGRLAVR